MQTRRFRQAGHRRPPGGQMYISGLGSPVAFLPPPDMAGTEPDPAIAAAEKERAIADQKSYEMWGGIIGSITQAGAEIGSTFLQTEAQKEVLKAQQDAQQRQRMAMMQSGAGATPPPSTGMGMGSLGIILPVAALGIGAILLMKR